MNHLDISRAIVAAIFAAALVAGGCGGSSSSSSDSRGLYQIDLTGGDSSTGTAGSGGVITLKKLAGQGNVQVLNKGVADSNFVPQALTPVFTVAAFGSKLWHAPASETTIRVEDGILPYPTGGAPYLLTTDPYLYISDGDNLLGEAAERVTGIYIPAGATVILEANSLSLLGEPTAQISLSADFYLAGTLKTVDLPEGQKPHLNLLSANFYSTGTIITAGVTPGQNGGSVEIIADVDTINHGPILTSGANSGLEAAGHAGYISLETQAFTTSGSVENTGLLTATGGGSDLRVGAGGNGGDIYFWPYLDARNSADIVANGGAGVDGGLGGTLDVSTLSGSFTSGGDLNLSGGRALSLGGWGGDGGSMAVYVEGGAITLTGTIDLSGADGLVAQADAGDGGSLDLFSYPSLEIPSGESVARPAGSIKVSGNIDLSGGNTISGTLGGGFAGLLNVQTYIEQDAPGAAQGENSTATVSFLGYKKIDLSGGNGFSGGDGGSVFFTHAIAAASSSTGKLINESDLITVGGNGDLMGGNGGNIVFDSMTSASNSADIIADGGDADISKAGSSGGAGGDVTVTAVSGFTDTGTISSSGGVGVVPGADGVVTVP